MMRANRDQLIEPYKMTNIKETLENLLNLMAEKKTTYTLIFRNYMDMYKRNSKKPLIGEDLIMLKDTETNDKWATNCLIFY